MNSHKKAQKAQKIKPSRMSLSQNQEAARFQNMFLCFLCLFVAKFYGG
jgi:hypothetical protein